MQFAEICSHAHNRMRYLSGVGRESASSGPKPSWESFLIIIPPHFEYSELCVEWRAGDWEEEVREEKRNREQ